MNDVLKPYLPSKCQKDTVGTMKLYAIHTQSHEALCHEWFLPSVGQEYELILRTQEQECVDGSYKSAGWTTTMLHKVEVTMDAIRENWGEIFVFSDVDIQFFKPTSALIQKQMKDFDLLYQRNTPLGGVCAGFYACRANEKTLKFFQLVRERMLKVRSEDDQDATNALLHPYLKHLELLALPFWQLPGVQRQYVMKPQHSAAVHTHTASGVRWGLLGPEFFSPGGTFWSPGKQLAIPKNIVLHHASWTKGVEAKVQQMKCVQSLVRGEQNE